MIYRSLTSGLALGFEQNKEIRFSRGDAEIDQTMENGRTVKKLLTNSACDGMLKGVLAFVVGTKGRNWFLKVVRARIWKVLILNPDGMRKMLNSP